MCVYGWAGWWWTCWWAFWKPVVESGRCHLCCRKWSEPCSSFGSRPAGARWTPVSGPRRGHGRTCPLSSTGQIGPRWYTWILGQGLSLHAQPQGSRQGKGRCHPQTCRHAFKRSNKNFPQFSCLTSSARCASAQCFSSGRPSPWPCFQCRSPCTCCSLANRGLDLSGCSLPQDPVLPCKLSSVLPRLWIQSRPARRRLKKMVSHVGNKAWVPKLTSLLRHTPEIINETLGLSILEDLSLWIVRKVEFHLDYSTTTNSLSPDKSIKERRVPQACRLEEELSHIQRRLTSTFRHLEKNEQEWRQRETHRAEGGRYHTVAKSERCCSKLIVDPEVWYLNIR